ncbi:hypothetical protein CPB85DRAFT_1255174 [Mucidula mucida]|nr:hypothetical protein CPB85DRAFT_1255174 [Mucidula mucida]
MALLWAGQGHCISRLTVPGTIPTANEGGGNLGKCKAERHVPKAATRRAVNMPVESFIKGGCLIANGQGYQLQGEPFTFRGFFNVASTVTSRLGGVLLTHGQMLMTETLFLTTMLDYPSIVQSNTCPMPNPSLDHVRDQNLSALIVVHVVVGKDTDTVNLNFLVVRQIRHGCVKDDLLESVLRILDVHESPITIEDFASVLRAILFYTKGWAASFTPQAHSTLLGDRRYKRKTHDEYIEHDIQYHRVFLRAVKCMELVVKMPVSRDEVSSFVKVLPSIIAHGNFKKALNDFFLATKGPTTGDGLYRRRIISLCTVVLNLLDQADPLPYMQGVDPCLTEPTSTPTSRSAASDGTKLSPTSISSQISRLVSSAAKADSTSTRKRITLRVQKADIIKWELVSYRPYHGWTYNDNMMPSSLKVPIIRGYVSELYAWTKADSYSRIFKRNNTLCANALEALSSLDGLNTDPLFLWVARWVRTVPLDYDHAVLPVDLLLEHVLGVMLIARHPYLRHDKMPPVRLWGERNDHPVPLCAFALPDGDARQAYQYEKLPPAQGVSDVLPSLAVVQPHTPDNPTSLCTFSNVLLCLDIAESVSKLIPGFGYIAEGACRVVRKIIAAVETARVARTEIMSLVTRTATLTIAILNEFSSCPEGMHINTNLMDFWVTLREVERTTATLCKYSLLNHFVFRRRIKDVIQDLTAKLETARIVFSVTRQISTTHLLLQLQCLQTRLMICVVELHQTQVNHNRVLNQKLDLIILTVVTEDRANEEKRWRRMRRTPEALSDIPGVRGYERKAHDEYLEHDMQHHRIFLHAENSISSHGNFKKVLNDFFIATKGPASGDGLYRVIIALYTVVLNLLDQSDPLPNIQCGKIVEDLEHVSPSGKNTVYDRAFSILDLVNTVEGKDTGMALSRGDRQLRVLHKGVNPCLSALASTPTSRSAASNATKLSPTYSKQKCPKDDVDGTSNADSNKTQESNHNWAQERTEMECARYAMEHLWDVILRSHSIVTLFDRHRFQLQYYDRSVVAVSTDVDLSTEEGQKLFILMVYGLWTLYMSSQSASELAEENGSQDWRKIFYNWRMNIENTEYTLKDIVFRQPGLIGIHPES